MRKDLPYSFSVPSEWYEGFYHDSEPLLKASRPFSIIHSSETDSCVLVIHGYEGYPGEMVRPAEALYDAGFDIFCPRLPGHGTTGEEFLRTGKRDWIGVPDRALDDLEKRYNHVYILGHSMGGAIAAILMAEHKRVEKAVLACPALEMPELKKGMGCLMRVLSLFVKRIPKPWQSDPSFTMYYEDAPGDDEVIGKRYWSFNYPKGVAELAGIVNAARRAFPSIDRPALVIGATEDASVSPRVAELAKRLNNKSTPLTVKGATHYIYYDRDKRAQEEAVEATVAFLSR